MTRKLFGNFTIRSLSVALVPALLAAVALTTACGGDDKPATTPPPPPAGASGGSTSGGGASVIDVKAVAGNAFDPRRPAVRAGQPFTVRIQNTDGVAHTFNIQNGPMSGNIAPGASATVNFTAPTGSGGIAFFCQIHGQNSMNGTITYQ